MPDKVELENFEASDSRHEEIMMMLDSDEFKKLLQKLRDTSDLPKKEFQALVIDAVETVADAEVMEGRRFDERTCRKKLRQELLTNFAEDEHDRSARDNEEQSPRIKAVLDVIPGREMDRLLHDEVEHHVMVENQARGKEILPRLLQSFLDEAHSRIFSALKNITEEEEFGELLHDPEAVLSKLRTKLKSYHAEEMQIVRFESFEGKGMPMPVIPTKDELIKVKTALIRKALGADGIAQLEKKMQKLDGNPKDNFKQLLYDLVETDHEVEGILDRTSAKALLEKLIDRKLAEQSGRSSGWTH